MKTLMGRTASAVISVSGILRTVMNAVVFSFFTLPASLVFIGILFCSLSGSLSMQFIDTAMSLTAAAPEGKVMTCQPEETPNQTKFPGPPVMNVIPCEKHAVDIHEWATNLDHTLKETYVVLVIISAGIWLLVMALFRWPVNVDDSAFDTRSLLTKKDGNQ